MAKDNSVRVRKIEPKDLESLSKDLDGMRGALAAAVGLMKALNLRQVEFDGAGKGRRGYEIIADFVISLEAAIKREKLRQGR